MTAPRLALSTMYHQRWADTHDLTPFVAAARSMGFGSIELSHILSLRAIGSIDPGVIHVAAVHHPCPRAVAGGAVATLVAPDKRTQRQAGAELRHTIDTGAAFGAKAVVLHLGELADDRQHTCRGLRFELLSRYAAGQRDTAAYDAARIQLLDWIRSAQHAHLDRAVRELPDLVGYAHERGIAVALETGYHAHELPLPDGMSRLLEEVPGLGAWIDTGHVGAQANLGLTRFTDWFAAVGERWTGAHFHDIVGLRDHLVPGMGTLDFVAIVQRLKPSVITTLEVDWYFSDAEIRDGKRYLEGALTAAWGRQA